MKFTCPDCGSNSFVVYKDSDSLTISGEFEEIPEPGMGTLGFFCSSHCGAEWGWWLYTWEIEHFIKRGDYSLRRLAQEDKQNESL